MVTNNLSGSLQVNFRCYYYVGLIDYDTELERKDKTSQDAIRKINIIEFLKNGSENRLDSK